uniref:Titin n=1 Tax=Anser cygnoides TaxID=8845 RepID=A0A8B9E4K1_ANSCY
MRGVPVPTAKWVTDGTEIKTDGRHKIETDNYSTVLTIKDCVRKDTGEYLLTVSNSAGSKTVALHLTVLDVPGPPTGPINILEVTPEHMVISWRPPKDDGGSPIINYIVEKRQSKKETWGVVSSGTSHTKIKIPRLQKGCEYIFRVRAENKIGIGAPLDSEPTVAKHMFDPPSPPGKPTVYDITENAATVSWTLPKSDGGTPITGYILERREASGKWVRVNKAPILDMKYRVTGLFEGNTYEFRVFAENMVGLSKPSPSSDPIKASRPITPPGPPINPKLKDKTKETADLVWTKPLKDGGSPILGYIVECQKTGTTQWNRINKDELIRQCAFRGEPRELAETVLAKDILSPPEVNLDVTCRDLITVRVGQTIRITGKVKGRPDPEITWSKDGKVLVQEKRVEIVHDLPNVELQVKEAKRSDHGKYIIAAKNSCGHEDLQKPVLDLKLSGVLTVKAGDPIRIEAGVRGKPQPEVVWTKDKDATDLTRSPRISIETTSDTSKFVLTQSRRSDGGKYVITATNTAGSFVAYATVIVLDKPGPVRNLKVTDISSDRCTVTWEPPEDDGGCEIQNYILEKCESKRMVWSTYSSSVLTNYANVTRLIEGNEYIFRVRAENKMGTGPPTETHPIIAKTKYDRPGRPDPPEVTRVSKEEMTVVWNPPEYDGGKSITGYILEKKEKRSLRWVPVTKTAIPERRKKVTNLIPGHEYQFRVSAENEVGLGEPSLPSRPVVAKDPIGIVLLYTTVVCLFVFNVNRLLNCITIFLSVTSIVFQNRLLVTVRAGCPIRLFAIIRGRPAPKVTWRRMGVDNVIRKGQVDLVDTMAFCVIPNSTRDDSGKYSLTLVNAAGEKAVFVNVRVLGE